MKKFLQVLFMTFLVILFTARFTAADGLLQVNDTKQFLYLSRCLVDVKIFDQIAITTVEHEFLNPVDADSVEVTYMFPLPDNAAVTNIAIWRDSLYVDFQLAASDSGGHQTLPGGNTDSDLLEYLKPNPFIIPVVARNDTVKIKLSYAELLPFDFGAIQYRYPLDSGQYSTGALDAFAILVTFATQRSLVDIQTPNFSSGIDIIDAFSATVGYDQARLIATRDFVLDYNQPGLVITDSR